MKDRMRDTARREEIRQMKGRNQESHSPKSSIFIKPTPHLPPHKLQLFILGQMLLHRIVDLNNLPFFSASLLFSLSLTLCTAAFVIFASDSKSGIVGENPNGSIAQWVFGTRSEWKWLEIQRRRRGRKRIRRRRRKSRNLSPNGSE